MQEENVGILVQKTIEHRHRAQTMQFWSVSTKRDIEEVEMVERRVMGLMRSTGPLTGEERINKQDPVPLQQ